MKVKLLQAAAGIPAGAIREMADTPYLRNAIAEGTLAPVTAPAAEAPKPKKPTSKSRKK